jgi:molecular chaperone DnaK (HSP70)
MDIGIDLGTTRSGVGIVESGDPDLIQNTNGNRLTPSIVLYKENGEILVGEQAKSQMKVNADNTVQEIKREMGKEGFTVTAGGEEYTPSEVSGEILEQLLDDARDKGYDIEQIVITVPAYFTSDQKRDTKEAAKIAGVDEDDIELLREPTAAALHHGDKHDIDDETVLVYDFGGGTLDISIVDIDDNTYTMLATSGDTKLGGVDFTAALVDMLADDYEDENGIDLRSDEEVYASLWENAEEAKIALSSHDETTISDAFMGEIDGELVGLEERVVTRDEFETAVEDLLDDAIDPLDEALQKGGLTKDEIDNVLLVGGSSNIPAVQDRLEDFFAFEPYMTNDLDWIVAYGAAIAADIDDDVATLYQCPVPDCDETNEGVTLVFDHIVDAHGTDSCPYPGCDKDPGSEDDLKSHLAGEHSKDIATTTTQDGGTKEIKKTIQRSYGTDVDEDRMHIIVPNGTELPAEGSAMFTTAQDNQTKVPVDVFQGENEDDRYENEQLHTWEITDLPKMDAREPDIEVTFEIDEDDILTVTAEEKKSGTKATTQISTEMSVNTSDSPRKTEADD